MSKFSDPEEPPLFKLLEVGELKEAGLLHLKKLILLQLDQDNFPIPPTHLEMLGLVRLADHVGVDNFMVVAGCGCP